MSFDLISSQRARQAKEVSAQPTRPSGDSVARSLILIGPGKHFGEELIRRFVSEGYRVGIVSAREATLDALRANFSSDVEFLQADINDTAAFGEALKLLAGRLGGVNCLIYNPKQSIDGNGLKTSPDQLELAMKVNVTGALVAIQALLPHMSGAVNASVILTGGGYKDRPDVEKFALSVGKAVLHSMVKTLSDPLRRQGVSLKTVVIDGRVRRETAVAERSSERLAEFYWEVFSHRRGLVHKFPVRSVAEETDQLSFLV